MPSPDPTPDPTPDLPDAAPAPPRLALTRREGVVIAGVWAAYAFLQVASRLFDRRWIGPQQLSGPATVALTEALLWALLTPLILALAARFGVEGDRTRRVVAFALGAVAVAGTMGWLTGEVRGLLDLGPRPRPWPGGPGPRRYGPPLWFGVLNALVLYLTVLAAGVARAYSRHYQARREDQARREARLQAQLAEARLDALRRQLDPHFLFNTLNAVSALVERDPRGVRRMIARLGDLLRHSFEGDDAPEVPLRRELALLGKYVDIMQVRFQGRLQVETEADEHALDALVPALVLQPLVENAIRHGVERRPGAGRIAIAAAREGAELVLRVSDDGPGVDPAAPARPGGGVGLRNTVARLEQLYGARQRFSLGPGPRGGTVAEVRLPFHTRGAAPDAAPDAEVLLAR